MQLTERSRRQRFCTIVDAKFKVSSNDTVSQDILYPRKSGTPTQFFLGKLALRKFGTPYRGSILGTPAGGERYNINS